MLLENTNSFFQAQYFDLEDKLVGDLGCGCGMLSIGSFLLGAQLTIGFELDPDAIDVREIKYIINTMQCIPLY